LLNLRAFEQRRFERACREADELRHQSERLNWRDAVGDASRKREREKQTGMGEKGKDREESETTTTTTSADSETK